MTVFNESTATRMTVQFFGDIALNGEYVANPGMLLHIAQTLSRQLHPADLRIANWESPIQGNRPSNPEKSLTVSTTLEAAQQVLPMGINVALLANNHTFDCLEEGFETTVSYLRSARIAPVGAGRTEQEAQRPLHLEVKGVPIVVLSYVDITTNPGVPCPDTMYLNFLDPGRALNEVRVWSRLHHTVLVCVHWGQEYIACPSPAQRQLSRELIEAGASIVACHHPHRLQGHEKWKEGHIFYSLGNFLFGNLYSGHIWPKATEPTVAVSCEIENRRVVGVRIQHFRLRNGSLSLCKDGPRRYQEKLDKPLLKSDEEYLRHWSRAVAYHNFLFRPMQFVRRNQSPWNWLSRIEKRHLKEYWGFLKSFVVDSNEAKLN